MIAQFADFKRQAAKRALVLVKPGMVLGLGTGSTANAFIELLAERDKAERLDLRCVATSVATEILAKSLGLPVVSFRDIESLDLTIDGADEIAPNLDLVKGGGGALLREKIAAMASERVCIIGDQTKLVERLGGFPIPVEVIEFGLGATLSMIEAAAQDAGCIGDIRVRLKPNGQPFITDNGHLIADCAFRTIPDAELLADVLDIVPGVVDHGLFIGVADDAIIAGESGVTVLKR